MYIMCIYIYTYHTLLSLYIYIYLFIYLCEVYMFKRKRQACSKNIQVHKCICYQTGQMHDTCLSVCRSIYLSICLRNMGMKMNTLVDSQAIQSQLREPTAGQCFGTARGLVTATCISLQPGLGTRSAWQWLLVSPHATATLCMFTLLVPA